MKNRISIRTSRLKAPKNTIPRYTNIIIEKKIKTENKANTESRNDK